MNSVTTTLIEDLSLLKGKSADHITHFLKRCGGGEDSTMVDGLINIVDKLETDKMYCVKYARINGIVIGVIVTTVAAGGSAYLIHKHREKRQNQKKIQEVAEILKQEVALANQEELPVDENEVIEDT